MSLIALGTIALDHVRTPAGERKDMLGGSVAHFAMSARFFTKVHLVAVVGNDFPKKYLRHLEQKGIDLTSVAIGHDKTFRWRGEYKESDLNTAVTLETVLGVLMNYEPVIADHQKKTPNVFLANFDPDVQMKLLALMDRPRLIGLDSMNLWINIKEKRKSLLQLMRKVDLFVANDAEARALTGESNLIKAAKALRKLGPKLVVVKKGEHGVLFYSDQLMFSFPAYPVEDVVDPTGAGDTFAGGLMGYLSSAKRLDARSLKQAVIYGTTLASFNVEGFGMSRTESLTLTKVNQRMKQLLRFISA
jgi:sugar/nucleoside kinase (ribokinase family)